MLKYSVLAVHLTCFRAIVISDTLVDSSAHGWAFRTLGPLGLLIVILKTTFLPNFSQIHQKTFFHIFCAGSFGDITEVARFDTARFLFVRLPQKQSLYQSFTVSRCSESQHTERNCQYFYRNTAPRYEKCSESSLSSHQR